MVDEAQQRVVVVVQADLLRLEAGVNGVVGLAGEAGPEGFDGFGHAGAERFQGPGPGLHRVGAPPFEPTVGR